MSVRHFEDIDLASLPINELRKVLNRKAQSILLSDNTEAYKRYLDFRKKYSFFVHNSWHVDPPCNQLFEFELTDEIDDGAFGRVFQASDPNGNTVAVKLLKEDVMRKDDWLQAFRRGVKAMQILNEHNISGMVKYISASEIPTFVAMEYVDGINLKKAIDTQQLKEWRDILRLLCEVSGIIAKAHGLPEKVLHRDIRPPNIMLRGFDYSSDDWSVCVLDFDLAFHKGANEVSIQQSSDTNGFLAPEQIERESKYTTRSALVDSYGMAMLIYYVVSRKSPKPEQSLHADWHKTLLSDIAAKRCEDWKSLPFRIARLIERCTRLNQAQRLDMTQIHGQLCALRSAYLNDRSVNDGELLAEELATRVANKLGILDSLRWDSDRFEANVQRHSGEELTVRSAGDSINVLLCWHNDGTAKFEDVRNTIYEAAIAAKTKFSKHGFNNIQTSVEMTGAMIDLILTNTQVCLQMKLLADLIAAIKLAPKTY
jgi:serine/threonine protein kinase